MKIYDISPAQLAELSSGDGSNISIDEAERFRIELIAVGYGTVDTSDIPEHRWNRCLNLAIGGP